MKTLQELYNGFFLDTACANVKISNYKIFLRVAPIEKVNTYKELEIEKDNFAFAEKNTNGEIEYFHGLKNFLWIEKSYFPPIFIFDNHNHAIVFRYNIIYNKNFKDVELIHIDQHSDCRENKNHLELSRNEDELEKVFRFGNEKCNVGNFIPPAIKSGIISNQIQIRSTTALKNLGTNKNQNYILDIDLDFCLNGIDRKGIDTESIKILKEKFNEIGENALCITIATSPYFLDQNIATDILKELLN